MTHEEIDFVIDTLETSIEWAEYADDYFKKKHGLEQDKENVLKSIELLKALQIPKTCHSCVFNENSFCMHCDVPDGDTVEYIKFSGCGLHQPIPQPESKYDPAI